MALSRIWSAFIIISMLVAVYKFTSGDETIFSRMVTGKATDASDTVSYTMIGSAEKYNITRTGFSKLLSTYGFKEDSAHRTNILVTDDVNADSVNVIRSLNPSVKVYTYKSVQNILIKNIKGLKELGFDDSNYASQLQIAQKISDHIKVINTQVKAMIEARKVANEIMDSREKAVAYCDDVKKHFDEIRYHVDKLELLVDDEFWELPKYRELLFLR